MHTLPHGVAFLLAISLTATCLHADPAPPQRNNAPVAASTTQPPSVYAADPNDYHIGPLDLLDIKVLRADDLSRTVRVDARGNISLPLIGVVHAAGLTGYELERSVAEKLGKDYLQDPQVSVFIKEFTSQRVTVQGVVKRAGVYDFQGQATLLQAISMGGGLDEKADESAVKVIRQQSDGSTETMVFDLVAIRQGSTPNPLLKGGDIVVADEAQPVTVEGMVSRPGVFYPRGHATLMQLISQAGGLQELADSSAIKVFSINERKEKITLEYDIDKIRQGQLQDPLVHPGDVVVVERSAGRSLLQGVANTLRGFVGFGTIPLSR